MKNAKELFEYNRDGWSDEVRRTKPYVKEVKEFNIPRVLKDAKVYGTSQSKEAHEDGTRYSIDQIHYTKGLFYYILNLSACDTDWVAGSLYKMDQESYQRKYFVNGHSGLIERNAYDKGHPYHKDSPRIG